MTFWKSKSKRFKNAATIASLFLVVAVGASYVLFYQPRGAEATWFSTSWAFRRQITIDHTKVAGTSTLANFPVLVSVTNANFISVSHGGHVGNDDGTDILFTASDGATQLNHEIESYSSTTGAIVAWVQAPSVSTTTDTAIYMYYGNAGVADQQHKTATWDTNYKAVYHFKLLPSNLVDGADQTTNNNSAIQINNLAVATGQMGSGASLASQGSLGLEIADSTSLHLGGNTMTLSGWLKPTNTTDPQEDYIFVKPVAGDNPPFAVWGLFRDSGTQLGNFSVANDSPGTDLGAHGGSITAGAWNYLTGTYDGSNIILYLNGYPVATTSASMTIGSSSGVETGIGYDTQNNFSAYIGSMDEMRISNSARAYGWILTEYNNQNAPGTFETLAGEETAPTGGGGGGSGPSAVKVTSHGAAGAGWYSTGGTWLYRKQITIDHRQILGGTNLTNFPVLLTRTDPDFKVTGSGGLVGKSDGTDILFTASDGTTKLNYEQESYNSATGQLTVWVQVPTVTVTADTVIYMYYGNAAASDQTNKNATWDTNFKGVWHLDESASPALDSTSGGHSASQTNGPTFGVAGVVGNAVSFNDASSQYLSGSDTGFPSGAGARTLTLWYNLGGSGNYQFFAYGTANTDQAWGPQMSPTLTIESWVDDFVTTFLPTQIAWHFFTGTFDGTTANIYNDNVLIASGGEPLWNTLLSGTFYIGINVNAVFNPMLGQIDEIQLSNIARPVGWTQTEYLNQQSPSTFATFGTRQTQVRQSLSSISLVQTTSGGFKSVSGTATSLSIDFGSNISAGHFVAIIGSFWDGTGNISATIGSEATPVKLEQNDAGSPAAKSFIFYVNNTAGGSKTVTLTSSNTAANTFIAAEALEFSGVAPSSFTDGNTPGTFTTTNFTTSSLTPTQTGDLVLAGVQETNGQTLTLSPATLAAWATAFNATVGNGQGGVGLYTIATTTNAQSVSASYTSDGSNIGSYVLAAFKPAALVNANAPVIKVRGGSSGGVKFR